MIASPSETETDRVRWTTLFSFIRVRWVYSFRRWLYGRERLSLSSHCQPEPSVFCSLTHMDIGTSFQRRAGHARWLNLRRTLSFGLVQCLTFQIIDTDGMRPSVCSQLLIFLKEYVVIGWLLRWFSSLLTLIFSLLCGLCLKTPMFRFEFWSYSNGYYKERFFHFSCVPTDKAYISVLSGLN